ncbi:MAG TPA: Xaa-Pro peptidase family protein [Pirellulales bacterium]|jgi:Xaa-Pro aminopeptidase|nr:Xaa-Pro peptidase family protein [Pirellulales bacterium]
MTDLSTETDLAACRSRQRRLIEVMERLDVDLAIITQNDHVQYLAGPRFRPTFWPAAALARDGRLTLVAPADFRDAAAADQVVPYEAQWLCTLRNDQRAASTAALWQALGPVASGRRIGVEYSSCGLHVTEGRDAKWIDVEPDLFRLRRRKDPDELARLKRAIAATAAMYARAREIVMPGVNELDVFSELQAAAVRVCGEMLTGTGNDYASGVRGGLPRNRKIEAGELYILDLGPAYRGYYADNCRVIAVDREPTKAQRRAWEQVCAAFPIIEQTVKPGVKCRTLYDAVKAHLLQNKPWEFDHHLGHGIGLFPHEAPHINPSWDDTFEEGEVIAVEPGLYSSELREGVRLENNYLITKDGVELLTPFTLEL